MATPAVSFELEFPARRQLQAATDPSSAAFQLSLKQAIAASLGAGIDQESVVIEATSNPRILGVTITNFGTGSATSIVAAASSDAFVGDIASATGAVVAMRTPPAITMRTTSVPSPPPPAPPTPPPPVPPQGPPMPPAVPLTGSVGPGSSTSAVVLNPTGSSALTGGGSSAQTAQGGGGLTTSMMWVIIVVVIFIVLVLGCATAYYCGKRTGKKTTSVQIGRPALRKTPSHSRNDSHDEEEAARRAGDGPGPTDVRIDDVRLIELGMQLQRQQSGGGPSSPRDQEVHARLDGAQAAIESLRESLDLSEYGTHGPLVSRSTLDLSRPAFSGVEFSPPTSPSRASDVRIRKSGSLDHI